MDLINAGAFNGIDVAMMSHPFPENDPIPIMLAREKYVPPMTPWIISTAFKCQWQLEHDLLFFLFLFVPAKLRTN